MTRQNVMSKEERWSLEFELLPEHVTLLRNSYVSDYLSGVEWGAAEIDGKRPYGNSSVFDDIAELLNLKLYDENDDLVPDVEEKCEKLHAQTPRALQIVLKTGSFEPGLYRRSAYYYNDWKKV